MKRRAFNKLITKGVGVMGASAGAMRVGLPALDGLVGEGYDQEKIAEQEQRIGAIRSYYKQQVDGILQLPETVIESMAQMICEEILLFMVKKVLAPKDEKGQEIRLGSSDWEEIQKYLEEAKVNDNLLLDTLIAATKEEVEDRLPADLFERVINHVLGLNGQLNWSVGIINSFKFAYDHGRPNDYVDSNGTSFIPLPQFIGGMFYWYLTRTRGLPNAIVAHTLQNWIYTKTEDWMRNDEPAP